MTTLAPQCPEHSRPTGIADCAACLADDERERSDGARKRIAGRIDACLRASGADLDLCFDDEAEGGDEDASDCAAAIALMEAAADLLRKRRYRDGGRVGVTGLARGDGR